MQKPTTKLSFYVGTGHTGEIIYRSMKEQSKEKGMTLSGWIMAQCFEGLTTEQKRKIAESDRKENPSEA